MFGSNRFITLDIGASKVILAEFAIDKTGIPQLVNYGVGALGVEAETEADPTAYIVATIRELMREHKIKPAPLGLT
ncbi:MAG: hypothetical protein N2255_00905, partial [Kiritimatiellae bacterium]|nr:hypothetical protein [Kiritimatiellia bacterium]